MTHFKRFQWYIRFRVGGYLKRHFVQALNCQVGFCCPHPFRGNYQLYWPPAQAWSCLSCLFLRWPGKAWIFRFVSFGAAQTGCQFVMNSPNGFSENEHCLFASSQAVSALVAQVVRCPYSGQLSASRPDPRRTPLRRWCCWATFSFPSFICWARCPPIWKLTAVRFALLSSPSTILAFVALLPLTLPSSCCRNRLANTYLSRRQS